MAQRRDDVTTLASKQAHGVRVRWTIREGKTIPESMVGQKFDQWVPAAGESADGTLENILAFCEGATREEKIEVLRVAFAGKFRLDNQKDVKALWGEKDFTPEAAQLALDDGLATAGKVRTGRGTKAQRVEKAEAKASAFEETFRVMIQEARDGGDEKRAVELETRLAALGA